MYFNRVDMRHAQRVRMANKLYWESWQSEPKSPKQAHENEKQAAAMLQGVEWWRGPAQHGYDQQT